MVYSTLDESNFFPLRVDPNLEEKQKTIWRCIISLSLYIYVS